MGIENTIFFILVLATKSLWGILHFEGLWGKIMMKKIYQSRSNKK